MNETSRLYIVDGSSLLYRSFYGVKPLHTATGEATHAIYGFFRTLARLTDDLNPSHLLIAWDTKGKTHRHTLYEAYKATRQIIPTDLISQKHAILTGLDHLKVAQYSRPGLEADDIIYSFIHDNPETPITVITGDKDLHQLLDHQITMYDPFKQKVITEASFIQERGFAPSRLLLYHSLLGDASDNIPGVKGIGQKTATQLTQQFATLEELYEKIEHIDTTPRIRRLLAEGKESALLSKKLFTLHHHPLDLTLESCRYDRSHWRFFSDFLQMYHIRPFAPKGITPLPAASPTTALTFEWKTHIVTTPPDLEKLCDLLEKAPIIALDTETTGINFINDRLLGISCCVEKNEAYYIPLEQENKGLMEGPLLTRSELEKRFIPLLESPAYKKTLHNAKFDDRVLRQADIHMQGIAFDTMLAAFLCKNGEESVSLKQLSEYLLQEPMRTYKEIVGKHKSLTQVPLEDVARYAAHDARQTLLLTRELERKLASLPQISSVFYTLELPLSTVLTDMEEKGILLDKESLIALCAEVETYLNQLETIIKAEVSAAGEKDYTLLNLNSPQQIEHILFDVLALPTVKKSKTGKRSTDADVLSQLAKEHPIAGFIQEYRELSKLKTGYLSPLPTMVNEKTNRIHTVYNQATTATGRLSSTQPNLQNIPTGGAFGTRIRHAFPAAPDHCFLSADYSQIELRILAHVTQDEALLAAFANEEDIHRKTAVELFGGSLESITAAQRQIGKKINFSIMYGLTPFGLSKDLGISVSQAKEYIECYFARYPKVKEWMHTLLEKAKQTGYVKTWYGRRRYVPGLQERNKHVYDAAARMAINTPIQGTAADIIKKAMVTLHPLLTEHYPAASMILQIHDELLFELPRSLVTPISTLVKQTMERVVDWPTRLTVCLREGSTWGEVSK